jgi:hypothetical protein
MGICWRDYGKFLVEELWKISDRNPTYFLNIDQLIHMLNVEIWMEGTPMDVLNGKVTDLEKHKERILNADIELPIIITFEPSSFLPQGKCDILDGIHRLVKCYLLKITKVPVKILLKEEILKAKITKHYLK